MYQIGATAGAYRNTSRDKRNDNKIIVSFSIYKRAIYDLVIYEEYFNPIKEQSKNNMGKRVGIIRTV